ncbi:DUF6668 family protein [Catellatospora sp. NPDC049133]|uniref:DUF6668 family protein n=1 Tax=Catellatospora sp. NPDC049133 TaxID=3155499 RepID=UPI0033EC26F0
MQQWNSASTRRLGGHYLGIARSTPPAPSLAGPLWPVQWLGCHGGAGVTTLSRLTGVGHDAGRDWPSPASEQVPVVLVCRASGSGTAAAATAIEQSRTSALAHVRLLGLVIVAASPKPVSAHVTARLLLIAGWLTTHWWVGWQEAYISADDPRTVGPSPQIQALRAGLVELMQGSVA